MIRCLLIDDERLAREELKLLLKEFDGFQVVAEASNAEEGIQAVAEYSPDLIFLDIHMPEKTGFDMLEELDEIPKVIFTTAYDQYAIKAFEYNALDYLLKPIRMERMEKAMRKVEDEIMAERKSTQPDKAISLSRQVFIKDGERCYFVKLKDVVHIESVGNYARFHFNGEKALLNRSLNTLQARLDNHTFFRANRQEIINLDFIETIQPKRKGTLRIILTTGKVVEVSERRSVWFKERMSI